MSGPSQQTKDTQNDITQQSLQISQQQQNQSQQEYQQAQQLLAPDIARLTAISGGSKSAAFAAEAPVISQITAQTQKNAGQISESIGPGVAKDVALAQNITGGGSAISSNLSSAYTSSFDKLAALGSGIGSFSLNSAGAALSGLNSASNSNQVVEQQATAQKGQTLGFFGELAGAAGGAAAGGAFGKLCWIAEAIYGVDSPDTHMIRAYLLGPFRESWMGSLVVGLYSRFGQRIAVKVRRYALLKASLKPLFDLALRKAKLRISVAT